jgi:hypothetical protein
MSPGKLLGRQVAERAVGPLGVVLDSARFNQGHGMPRGDKPVFVQAFVPEASVRGC